MKKINQKKRMESRQQADQMIAIYRDNEVVLDTVEDKQND